MHFHYITYSHTLAEEPLPRGSWKLHLGRPFLGHHYYTLILSETCSWVEKKIFKEIHQFYTFYPQITSPLCVCEGVMKCILFCFLILQMLHTMVNIGSVVLEKKMLTDDGRWTTHDDGCQPIVIGHLSDLKIP